VWNKVDMAGAPDTTPEAAGAVRVSARTGQGIDTLLAEIDKRLSLDPTSRRTFRIPAGEGGALHLLHERARVLNIRYLEDVCEVEAETPASLLRQLETFLVP
jgi:GTP-binding protein HflX